MSANGIKVVFPNCFITNGNCKISFMIENKKFELQSCYIRSESVDNEYLISFSFTKINDSDREFILQFCLKKQLEQRRKNLF
jgi:c-di-GMP-binding flagellar brake protein YcgR